MPILLPKKSTIFCASTKGYNAILKFISSHTDGIISRIEGYFLLTFYCSYRTRYNLLGDE